MEFEKQTTGSVPHNSSVLQNSMDLSIIIVSYNTKELTKQTLESIYQEKNQDFDYEIFVVDNHSQDGSIEMIQSSFPEVKLIVNEDNLGFSKANNMAIKKANGRFILLLNSDTFVNNHCLEKSLKYLQVHSEVGALGCKVMLPDGTLDHACKRGFPTPVASLYYLLKLDKLFPNSKKFGAYDLTYLSEDETHEVDSLMGAFMMVRKETIESVGLLDEDYFMYGEDIDWCYRIKQKGWKIIYYPEAGIIHYKGGSSKKKKAKLIYEFHKSMWLFFKKHYQKDSNILVVLLVVLGIFLKMSVSLFINLFKKRGQ